MAMSSVAVMLLLAACAAGFPDGRQKRGYNGYDSSYSGLGYGSSDERDNGDASVSGESGCGGGGGGGGYHGRGSPEQTYGRSRDRDMPYYGARRGGRYFSRAATAAAAASAYAYKMNHI